MNAVGERDQESKEGNDENWEKELERPGRGAFWKADGITMYEESRLLGCHVVWL
jgi:hypothetical protein